MQPLGNFTPHKAIHLFLAQSFCRPNDLSVPFAGQMIYHVQNICVFTASSVVLYSNLSDFHFQVEYVNFPKMAHMQFQMPWYT